MLVSPEIKTHLVDLLNHEAAKEALAQLLADMRDDKKPNAPKIKANLTDDLIINFENATEEEQVAAATDILRVLNKAYYTARNNLQRVPVLQGDEQNPGLIKQLTTVVQYVVTAVNNLLTEQPDFATNNPEFVVEVFQAILKPGNFFSITDQLEQCYEWHDKAEAFIKAADLENTESESILMNLRGGEASRRNGIFSGHEYPLAAVNYFERALQIHKNNNHILATSEPMRHVQMCLASTLAQRAIWLLHSTPILTVATKDETEILTEQALNLLDELEPYLFAQAPVKEHAVALDKYELERLKLGDLDLAQLKYLSETRKLDLNQLFAVRQQEFNDFSSEEQRFIANTRAIKRFRVKYAEDYPDVETKHINDCYRLAASIQIRADIDFVLMNFGERNLRNLRRATVLMPAKDSGQLANLLVEKAHLTLAAIFFQYSIASKIQTHHGLLAMRRMNTLLSVPYVKIIQKIPFQTMDAPTILAKQEELTLQADRLLTEVIADLVRAFELAKAGPEKAYSDQAKLLLGMIKTHPIVAADPAVCNILEIAMVAQPPIIPAFTAASGEAAPLVNHPTVTPTAEPDYVYGELSLKRC